MLEQMIERIPRFVVTLDSILASEATLARIPIAITGKWVRDGNEFSITPQDLEEIVRNFGRRQNGEINVDYDHASELPEVAAGGPIPSAGRIVKLDLPEEIGRSGLGKSEGGGEKSEVRSLKSEGTRNASSGSSLLSPGSSITNRKSEIANPSIAHHPSPITSSSIGNRQSAIGGPQVPSPQARYILWGWYEPTERARKLIRNREYRYISPAIDWTARNKRTGKAQGTTLTTVALTNRPFLEELPEIRLSDPSYRLIDAGDVHVEGSMEPFDLPAGREADPQAGNTQGGAMKQVKVSAAQGKLKVAHDDFNDEYFADPAEVRSCLDELAAPPEGDGSVAELATLAGLAPAGEAEPGAKRATLAECVSEIRRRLAEKPEISLAEAGALLSENEARGKSIDAAVFFRAQVERELDEAVKGGKVLPRQREDWRKIALSDFPTFRKILAEQKPLVGLRPVGLSGPGPEDAPTQVRLLAEQRARERGVSFGRALSEVGREHPELVNQYRRAVSGTE